jgi:hypothetical protein
VSTPDSGFSILIDKHIKVVTGENFSHDGTDGLNTLTGLTGYANRHIYSHRFSPY